MKKIAQETDSQAENFKKLEAMYKESQEEKAQI